MKFLTFLTDLPDNVLGRALREGRRPAMVAFGFSLVSNVLYRLFRSTPIRSTAGS